MVREASTEGLANAGGVFQSGDLRKRAWLGAASWLELQSGALFPIPYPCVAVQLQASCCMLQALQGALQRKLGQGSGPQLLCHLAVERGWQQQDVPQDRRVQAHGDLRDIPACSAVEQIDAESVFLCLFACFNRLIAAVLLRAA